jgi:ribose 5-phosphate isomerase B
LIEQLRGQGHEVFDHGPKEYDALDDYPAFCINAALAVVRDEQAAIEALGIVLGGSGNGEQMAANKVQGIRAALVWNESTAKLARQHNNANVVAVGLAYASGYKITFWQFAKYGIPVTLVSTAMVLPFVLIRYFG